MTEISKMYENARIKGEWRDYRTKNGKIYEGKNPKNRNIRLCKPQFTAEKQLKICEWFISNSWWLNLKSLDKKLDFSLDFDEKLAKLVNRLWESFDDQEKEEIRSILNA